MCGTDVVEASTIEAATPIVPLATMFHAAHSPGCGQVHAEHLDARSRPTSGSSRANSRNGTSMTSRRARRAAGPGRSRRPARRARRARRRPRTAPSAWRRRRTRTAPSPAACTAGRGGAAGPPRAPAGAGAIRPLSPAPALPAGGAPAARAAASHSTPATDGERHGDADQPGRGPCQPVVVRRPGRRSRRAGCRHRARRALAVDARVGGDLLQPVGLGLACGATNTTSSDGDGRPASDEGGDATSGGGHVSPPRRAGDRRPARAGRCARAPYTRSGRVAITAPTASAVMMPSPMPMSTCTPTIDPATAPMDTASLPPMAYSTTNASAASTGAANAATPAPIVTDAVVRPSSRRTTQEHAVADERADEGHVDDVQPERRQPAVGEEQALHDEHDGHGQRAGVGADEHGGEHAAEQVAAGAAGHREVEHLRGEDEGRDEARRPGSRGRRASRGHPQRPGHHRRWRSGRRRSTSARR